MYPFIDALDSDFNGIRTGVQHAYHTLLHSLTRETALASPPRSEIPRLTEICEHQLQMKFDVATIESYLKDNQEQGDGVVGDAVDEDKQRPSGKEGEKQGSMGKEKGREDEEKEEGIGFQVIHGDDDPTNIDVQLIDFQRIIGSGVQRQATYHDE